MNIIEPSVSPSQKAWQKVKGELISRYGSVRAAAARLDCHPNSVRAAVDGLCPGVRERLDAMLAARDRAEVADAHSHTSPAA